MINSDKRGSDNQSISPKVTPNNRELSGKISDNQSISPKATPNNREPSGKKSVICIYVINNYLYTNVSPYPCF